MSESIPQMEGSTSSAPNRLARSALVLALGAAVLAAGVAVHQRQQLQTQAQHADSEIAALRVQIVKLTTHNSAALNALTSTQQQLQQQQADLQALIVGGAAQFADAQRLHAAEYLVREAEQVLLLSQDIPAARRMLETAVVELDNGSKNTRMQKLLKALRADVSRLREFAGVDALAVARAVAQALERVENLRDLQPQLELVGTKPKSGDERRENENGSGNRYAAYSANDSQWWRQFSANLHELSRDWFVVRHYGHEVEAPLSLLEQRELKQSLKLALASAQAAALRHEQGLYYSAIRQAVTIVDKHFANSTDGVNLLSELEGLSQRLVSVTATFSLQASALVDDDKNPASSGPGAQP